jgi:hypothetical protein
MRNEKRNLPIFYVYEHWRPDTGTCFWVGKGHGYRMNDLKKGRNKVYRAIIEEIEKLGIAIEIRIVKDGLVEADSHALEIERISYWRAQGVCLSNISSGGYSACGHRHSDETKEKIRQKRRLQKIQHSEETKRKIGAANAGVLKGRKNPEHSKFMTGRTLSKEHREKLSAARSGKPLREVTKEKTLNAS